MQSWRGVDRAETTGPPTWCPARGGRALRPRGQVESDGDREGEWLDLQATTAPCSPHHPGGRGCRRGSCDRLYGDPRGTPAHHGQTSPSSGATLPGRRGPREWPGLSLRHSRNVQSSVCGHSPAVASPSPQSPGCQPQGLEWSGVRELCICPHSRGSKPSSALAGCALRD